MADALALRRSWGPLAKHVAEHGVPAIVDATYRALIREHDPLWGYTGTWGDALDDIQAKADDDVDVECPECGQDLPDDQVDYPAAPVSFADAKFIAALAFRDAPDALSDALMRLVDTNDTEDVRDVIEEIAVVHRIDLEGGT